ncbi:cytochrome B [Gibbsiella quercinecans]|uniref:cytochrome b561 n=1 Tax=Gibbsiella quercinecans TaxID=929813 RepID=UPI000EF24BC6|nr:cytochrome b561 [Gibbsiella quercinecans]RLM09346.1 cytochrome B [Gibbsiella quercinecans]
MENRYAPVQIRLHWWVFILLVITCATIELRTMAEIGTGPWYVLVVTHFSCGVAVFFLMIFRLILRHRYPTPAIVPPPPKWQAAAASTAHILIYLLLFTLPILGVYSRYIGGREWFLFGIPMPFAEPADRGAARAVIGWHKTLANLGYWLIGLHAAAALFHHYLVKDNTLLRMMPFRKRD